MYMEHFGLSGQPFQLTPDARFWYNSRTHRKAMAYLGYGLAQSEGFITVTGEIGAGKSTLAAHLIANIDRARLNAISLVSTQIEGDDMLRLVAQGLGIDTRAVEKARLLDSVEQRLEEELRSCKRTLLVVDEAQILPVSALEELRMLSNFQVGGRALIQILLLGQPEFRDKLAGPGLEQLRQRVIASHHLEAMGDDEVGSYLRHRLTRVDWQGNPEFDAGAVAEIHRASGGIPRQVNQIAHRLLLQAAIEGKDRIDSGQVRAVAAELGADAGAAPAPAVPAPAAASEEKVLPLRSARLAPVAANEAAPALPPAPVRPDPEVERRIEALEARAEEQEATLRRVLVLLVDWVENSQEPAYRSRVA